MTLPTGGTAGLVAGAETVGHDRTVTASPALRRVVFGVRTRVLAWFVLLLTLSMGASVLVIRQVLLARVDDRIEGALRQEAEEFRTLVSGTDPRSGRPFGSDAAAIFDVYLSRNIPSEREALFTLVGGAPYRETPSAYSLFNDAGLVDRWSSLRQDERGSVRTPSGQVEYLAVPVLADKMPRGVFVVANYPGERQEVEDAIRVIAAVTLGVLTLASVMAWVAAGRALAPLRAVTETARSITGSDLSRRIQVTGGDELAELSRTFNDMLARLQAAFRSQREFAQDAGHELRTPITVIRGHLELMGDDPSERAEIVALVTDELDRMTRLVEDLLLLASAERSDFLRLESVDVEALTSDVLLKAAALEQRDWRLEATASVRLNADPQRLTQALMQLAQNACQYTRPGDMIGIGSRANHTTVTLWVRDTGVGVPEVDQKRIFSRFARGSDVPRRAGDAGLGLAIVQAIAEAHGGRVDLSSRPGAGALFSLVIPLRGPVGPADAL